MNILDFLLMLLLAASTISVLPDTNKMGSEDRRSSLRVQAVREPQGWGLTGSSLVLVEAGMGRRCCGRDSCFLRTVATSSPEATKPARGWELKFPVGGQLVPREVHIVLGSYEI